jgi:hypothetical protein
MTGQPSLFADPEPRAVFSPCGRYRYALSRVWSTGGRFCLFVMLNPSTADAEKNDPTIRRCIGYAKSWGFDGLDVANLFALRSTEPVALYDVDDPIGPANDEWIARLAARASRIVCAWGNHGSLMGRGDAVVAALVATGAKPLCLGLNGTGSPVHPLYQPKDVEPMPMIDWQGEG